MNNYTRVDLMRHGACEGGDMLRGVTDVPLSQLGWAQMRAAICLDPVFLENTDPKNVKQKKPATTFESYPQANWQHIITSPLQRCRCFAEEQAARLQIPLQEEPRFQELNFGDWDGRLIKDIQTTHADELRRYFVTPTQFTPPGGESFAEVLERVSVAWRELLTNHQHEHLLLVQHSATIRILLSYLLEMPLDNAARIDVPYASITRIHVYHHGQKLYPIVMGHNNWRELNGD